MIKLKIITLSIALLFHSTLWAFTPVHQGTAHHFVNELKEEGLLSFTDRPAINIFLEQTCGNELAFNLGIEEKEKLFCEIVTKSDTCQEIPANDLRNCEDKNNVIENGIDVIVGCAKGLFNSVKELLSFLWEAAKFVWDNVTDWDKAAKSADSVAAFSQSIKLYLYTEYDKAYETASFPRGLNAAREVASGIFKFLGSKIGEILEDQYTKFGCLNPEAKTRKVCHVIGDLVLPPAAFFAFLKRGVRAADEFPSLSKAFDGMNGSSKLADYKVRLGQADQLLGKQLTQAQQEAVVRAHLVGVGEIGLDGTLAKVGNYTPAQLRRKNELLKQAGLNKNEVRVLMENSIVGIGPDEFARIPAYQATTNGPITPDMRPEYESVRAPLREGRLPQDPYVSFVAPDGTRLPARIESYSPHTGESILILTDGRRITLAPEQLSSVRHSSTAREAFQGANSIRIPAHAEANYEVVRRSLRSGEVPADPFVSYLSPSGHRLAAKIEQVDSSTGRVLIRLDNGQTQILQGEELLSLRSSSTAREAFTSTQRPQNLLPPSSDPRVAPIRDSINRGVPPNDPYVSVVNPDGSRVAARIDSIDPQSGRVSLTFVDGSSSYITKSQIESLRLSDTSRDAFSANNFIHRQAQIVTPAPQAPALTPRSRHLYEQRNISGTQSARYADKLSDGQRAILEKNRAYPNTEFDLPNGKMAVSSVMDMGGGRNFAFIYLTLDDGTQVVRSAYRSNSQGVWRLSDAMSHRHFSKGVGEEFMSIPPDVQRHLHTQRPVREISLDDIVRVDGESLGYGLLDQLPDFKKYNVMDNSQQMIPRMHTGIPPVQRPQNIRILDENLRPDFQKLQSTHRFNHPHHGDVEVLVYPSKNGAVSFTVMKDPEGKIWFADVYPNAVEVNAYGIPRHNYDFGDLATPRWEYPTQVAQGYLRQDAIHRGNYVSNWDYVKEIPEVQAWYRAQGLPVPD